MEPEGHCDSRSTRDVGPVILKVRFDCKGLAFRADLDFDKLLRLADNADLEKLDDFASIDVFEHDGRSHRGRSSPPSI